ncbi:MAG: hypothetical protein M1832_005332 [Thelocarpon impressellum]|nr:MAG: hypothetical protein M1832_005332 [Thelocarpon impressellum]
MTTVDPSTGQPLPPDVIQRVLFIGAKVHVYQIPPLTSTKGYMAASWTADPKRLILDAARLRIVETAVPAPDGSEGAVSTNVLLEDGRTGELFAAAPYTSAAVVEQVLDSSRFFAVRVQGDGGRRAVLGLGFEERSDAFDFGVALQEVRKVQGLDKDAASGRRGPARKEPEKREEKKDFSLKEGQTITLNIGGKGGKRPLVSSAPPPSLYSSSPSLPFLPPPPSAHDIKAQRRRSKQDISPEPTVQDLGFDDGEFGEFQ